MEDDGEKVLRTSGAMQLALCSMAAFRSNQQIQQVSCDLLRNLFADAAAGTDFAPEGVNLIVGAHKRFPGSVCAGHVLRNLLVIQPENRDQLNTCLRLDFLRMRRDRDGMG